VLLCLRQRARLLLLLLLLQALETCAAAELP
jgi:hypothetical protein